MTLTDKETAWVIFGLEGLMEANPTDEAEIAAIIVKLTEHVPPRIDNPNTPDIVVTCHCGERFIANAYGSGDAVWEYAMHHVTHEETESYAR